MKINTEEEYQIALKRKADLMATTTNENLTDNTDFATLRMAINVYEKEKAYKNSLIPLKRQAGFRSRIPPRNKQPEDTYQSYTASSRLTKEMSNTYAHTHHKKNSSPGNYSQLQRTQRTQKTTPPAYVTMNNYQQYPGKKNEEEEDEDKEGIYNTLRDEGF